MIPFRLLSATTHRARPRPSILINALRTASIRPFAASSTNYKKQDNNQVDIKKDAAQKSRLSPTKASLRRVSLEAQRSRLIVNRAGRRFVDPGVSIKKVAAYCAAEKYDINIASQLLRDHGFDVDPYNTGLYPQVIHIQTPILLTSKHTAVKDLNNGSPGDVFVFPSGTLVAWNVPDRTALAIVEKVLPPATVNSHSGYVEIEKEDLEYIEDVTSSRSDIVGDTVVLGIKPDSDTAMSSNVEKLPATSQAAVEVDTILAKIAFSSGLARSTKLAVLERLTDAYFESTRSIPLLMSKGTPLPINKPRVLRKVCELLGFGSRLPFSRPFILRKTGELLSIRAQLNLYSELTDSLPDLFWDSRHELGLENYYDLVGRALDVGVRIKVLNEKIDYAQEIASVLRETLSERHSLRLEWGIIILIFIEVVFEFTKGTKEHGEKDEHKLLESLLEKYFQNKADAEQQESVKK
ncbi:hypothetical protein BT63DRAFT_460522 [Microthyrium microscopicum]|uniref:DUF155 domain-containing protein n=1 Tax=Microthyrium microscopicum TaxID=703497 RepID=A0A6A6TWW6_9PEZI|nr:hypothetical protein BT63DRAFT_460522 [Microthyrium microscopicum]